MPLHTCDVLSLCGHGADTCDGGLRGRLWLLCVHGMQNRCEVDLFKALRYQLVNKRLEKV